MPKLTPEAHALLTAAAQRHGFSPEAALTVLHALAAGGGTMAQFRHPELGGAGQWSQGGMVMIGDMFDHGLKHRVDALCSELARQLPMSAAPAAEPAQSRSQSQAQFQGGDGGPGAGTGQWWPTDLGAPASSGAQNDLRYAYFPAARRLAIEEDGRVALYDTGDHRIFGVSQQQGGGERPLTFSSDQGAVRLADLKPADAGARARAEPAAAAPAPAMPPQDAAPRRPPADDPLATIERLADLRQKGILTEAEFAAKKTELLGRL